MPLIEQAEGEITAISIPPGEYDAQTNTGNSYTLQLNTNTFSTPECNGHSVNGSSCYGWQQFIYSSALGHAIWIEYWLKNYGNNCPSPWYQITSTQCHLIFPPTPVPVQPATNLGNLEMEAVAGWRNTFDTIFLYVNGPGTPTYYQQNEPENILSLYQAWTNAEFNVVGDENGTEAIFTPGTELGITDYIMTTNGAYTSPTCTKYTGGATGESNNLTLNPTCSVYSNDPPTTPPSINYTESNSLIPNGTYLVESFNSSIALGDPGSSQASGTQMEQLTVTGAANQLWTVTNIGNNVIYLINGASGLALTVNTNASMAPVVQSAFQGGNARQYWNVTALPYGYFELTNNYSGLALDVVGGSKSNGAKIDQYAYGGKAWQQWSFTPY